MADGIRLNKALADAGICSRRAADAHIFAGEVTVNGKVETNPATRVTPGVDTLALRGRPVDFAGGAAKAPCWILLHKPVEVVCTVSDPEGRRTVLDLLPDALPPAVWRGRRLYPVGRLDYFSEGLLLLTDDGELAHRLMHPRWHLPRVYLARVRPENSRAEPADRVAALESALAAMRRGMTLAEGEKLAPVDARIIPETSPNAPGILLEMTLRQGLNRQIRRMCRDLGLVVLRLRRVRQGPVALGDMPPGAARALTASEIAELRRAVGL